MISEAHQAACCDLVAGVARIHGKVYLKVAGASMVPVLWPGDLVTVRSCDSSELQPGSIVVFRQNERLVVHRLMHWVGDCVVARGDARLRYDQPVKAGEVLGRVDRRRAKWPPREFATLPLVQRFGLGFSPFAVVRVCLLAPEFQNAKTSRLRGDFGILSNVPIALK